MKTILMILTVLGSFLANLETKTLQTDFNVTVAEAADAPMNYPGSITVSGERFVLTMFGLDAAYDGQTMYVYSAETDELTLSNPSPIELVQVNPFLFAKTMAGQCTVTEKEEGEQTVITLTPNNEFAEVNRFVLRVRNSDLIPLQLDIKEGTRSTTLKSTNPAFVTTLPKFEIVPEGDTFVNDMRL